MAIQTDSEKLTYEFANMKPHSRLWELILYIARESEGDRNFGKVKLAKILFFADFTSYRLYGEPITGARYLKQQFGPVPSEYFDILDEMVSRQEVVLRKEEAFPGADYDYQRIIAGRQANLVSFNGRDISIVIDIIRQLKGKSAKEISNLSHGIAWESVQLKDAIPYDLSVLADEEISDDEIARAQELIKEYGWDV